MMNIVLDVNEGFITCGLVSYIVYSQFMYFMLNSMGLMVSLSKLVISSCYYLLESRILVSSCQYLLVALSTAHFISLVYCAIWRLCS